MKVREKRVKCPLCGDRFTYIQAGAGRPPTYCDVCRDARKVEQTRARVQALRARRGSISS
jgi:hypothetical protein